MKKTLVNLFLSLFLTVFLFILPTNIDAQCYEECDMWVDEPGLFWVEAEYLYWWIKNSPESVPLVTQGPVVPNFSPVLNEPGTSIVLGGKEIKNQGRSGGRFTFGHWLCLDETYGIEGSYLFLDERSKSYQVSSDGQIGSEFLALPFFDPTTDRESSSAIARPGVFAGSAKLKIKNSMQGSEVNGLFKMVSCNGFNINGLIGFRYWNFEEHLKFTTDSPLIAPPDVFITKDRFVISNNFYGGQIGFDLDYTVCNFLVGVKGKLALGTMHEKVKIRGLLTTDAFGTLRTFPSGYLAQSTNSGKRGKTQFAAIPEVDIYFGYQISDALSLSLGYTFLYVSEMLWAGKQIDRVINPTQSPALEGEAVTELTGVRRPKSLHKSSNFWAQGLNVGVDYIF